MLEHEAKRWLSIQKDLGRAPNTLLAYRHSLESYGSFCLALQRPLYEATKGNADRFVERVRRFEPYAVRSTPQAFHRVLPVDGHHDNTAVVRFHGTVYDKQITIEDASVSHGIAIDAHQERGGFVVDQEVVEIERTFQVIFRRTGKARRYAPVKVRQDHRPGGGPFHNLQAHPGTL